MTSSRKSKFERCKHFHSMKQPLISLNLKYFIIQIKFKYLKSILQSRSSSLPSYCSLFVRCLIGCFCFSPFAPFCVSFLCFFLYRTMGAMTTQTGGQILGILISCIKKYLRFKLIEDCENVCISQTSTCDLTSFFSKL